MQDTTTLVIALIISLAIIISLLAIVIFFVNCCCNDDIDISIQRCGGWRKWCGRGCGCGCRKKEPETLVLIGDPLQNYTVNIDEIENLYEDDGWSGKYNFL